MQTPGTSRSVDLPERACAPWGLRAALLSCLICGFLPTAQGQEPELRRVPEPSFYEEAADLGNEPELRIVIEPPAGYALGLADAIYLAPPGYQVTASRTVGWDQPTSLAQLRSPGGIPLHGWSPPPIPDGFAPQYIPGGEEFGPPLARRNFPLPTAPTADLEATWTPGLAHQGACAGCDAEEHRFRVLPDGVLWKAYLAGVKESRLSAHIIGVDGDSTFFDGNLGGRFALWRYGNANAFYPEGLEFDIEGAAQVRLDIPHDVDVRSVDFRAGGFFTWGDRWRQTKLGYYHLSSHLGDEFLLKNPGYPRLNFARDVILIAHSIYLTDELRIYAEAGWAFWTDVTEPWEFQFGVDYSPAGPTGPRGAPFFALNGHLRQELDFGGNFVAQAGWAWKGDESGNMFRAGLHYFNGASSQFSFYHRFEQQIGFGIWFDR